MTWTKTLDGRDVFLSDEYGWFFEYQSQGWFYNPNLVTVPQGAPVSAKVEAWGERMTERPRGIWWSFANPREIRGYGVLDTICGFFVFLVTWAARGFIVFTAGFILLNTGEIWSNIKIGHPMDAPGNGAAFMAVVYLVGSFFAFLLLAISSLNQTQSRALTAAFVAHRMYDRFVHDVEVAESHGHHRHGHHGGSAFGHRPGS